MNIVLGANGHVGSAVAKTLLQQGQEVLVVLHSEDNKAAWQEQGAQVAVTDVNNAAALREVFRKGEKAFLLNPPAAPDTDTVAVETRSVNSILNALAGSGLKKVVAQSTYGAQPGEGIGDMGVLYLLEQGLAEQAIPFTIVRAAYYMSNWDMALQTARSEGIVHTLFQVDFKLPMVAP